MRIRGRSLALVLALLAVLVMIGCGDDLKDRMRADEIVQSALAAQGGLSSSHMEGVFVAAAQGTFNGAPLNVNLNSGKASIDADWAHRRIRAHGELGVGYNGMLVPIQADLYLVENCTCARIGIAGSTENWTRGSLSLDIWPYVTDPRLMNGLLHYITSDLAGEEVVGGAACDVLRITPDLTAIQRAVSEKYPPLGEIPDLAALFEELSVRVWVARDTSLITRVEVTGRAHATAEALGQAPSSDVLDIDFTLTGDASGFNEPVSIELPSEMQSPGQDGCA